MNLIVTTINLYPFVFPAAFLFSRIDPLYQFDKYIICGVLGLGDVVLVRVTVTILRFCILFPFLQMCRFLSLCIPGLVIWGCVFLEATSCLSKQGHKFGITGVMAKTILRRHDGIQIIVQTTSDVTSLAICILMGAGLILSVAFNFVILKMYFVMPIALYLYFPPASLIVLVIIKVLVPIPIAVHEDDKLLHWKLNCSLQIMRDSKRKYYKKRLKSLGIFKFYCAMFGHNFYFLKSSTKTKYQSVILSYTISVVMTKEIM